MSVETSGTVRMPGESGPGVAVRVELRDDRLKLVSGDELVGEWPIAEIGVHALQEGFAIRAEGEEFILTAEDDAALAEEMGVVAATPRLARKLAVRHNPEERPAPSEEVTLPSHFGGIAFALGGVLVLLGGIFLRTANAEVAAAASAQAEVVEGSGVEFWIAFVVGGVLMIALAYILSIGTGWGRILAIVVLAGVIVVFGLAISDTVTDASHLMAYGFVAGGLVVGVAVLFSTALTDD